MTLATIATLGGPILRALARSPALLPHTRKVLDRLGVTVLRHHYYAPAIIPSDIGKQLSARRNLPGLDFRVAQQLDLIAEFSYREELLEIPLEKSGEIEFGYNNGAYEHGDAELLYNIIRHFRPRRIVEIGCGQSTILMQKAISKNKGDDASYTCRHICIEPFEQPWLEQLSVELIRAKVEDCKMELFSELKANDILFIDSSHVIRPQGDVLFEYLEILPRMRSGVIVHIHDIFTPRDYPEDWIVRDRRMWNEQYLLEAFLSFNQAFEVLLAANMLANDHIEKLAVACPALSQEPERQPGAFWIRRI
ncbi:class I SAM-dependent methyltransferase [Parvibaculum sp.]|uniref:class I SAM-dependent methyltransferase n=1 Tax=Parvibaculum sp. TaxID=2024848 RepID=UPI001D9F7AF2|nr:class I SAM-dependent methyltransferase [Parvibaculum sp.]MBX3489199.1 class I SAM-dependent methyltransferase [Parvibaculum sp.]